ncbi:YceI family protein [Geobacter pelophilus]|uniref:YceI family protein n=1 Tax=Geoanaerobacter pelophilus TaxID=60036 RepID=A0AAW4LAD5_9BACT|nr:YceI family protein [Geoanaerobacter pelophilus]MBT0664151.1 YceI family protein [Geoanaerobacter pelophilus]
MTATITCQELSKRLADGDALLVVDVLPPEIYAGRHIPGACNACVYEMVFLDRIAELAPDPARPIVLYDASGTTLAAATAREKLLKAGYSDVRLLAGGLNGWTTSGYPAEAVAPIAPEPVLADGIYRLDPAASVLEWTGRNFNNRHYGRIPFTDGEIVISGGALQRGAMSLDMTGISNLDLKDETYRQMLIRHLKSDDFFAVDRYPVASIAITGWQAITEATPGTPDHTVQGELTIKGVTREIAFPAAVAPQEDGSLKAQATFDIDRTMWNICYGSGKLFEKLGMHLVHDRIDIELFIVARKSG